MTKASSIYGSFLAAEDIHEDTTAVISGVSDTTFEGRDGGAPRRRLILDFEDLPARLSLNKVNAESLINKFGDETDDWVGRTIVLFVDENVQYRGKRTPGLRIKFPESAAKPR